MTVSLGIATVRRWLSGPMLGLLVALFLFGHDVAMAGASHDSRNPPDQVDAGEARGHHARHEDTDSLVTDPNRWHGNCGVAPDAVAAESGARRHSDLERTVSVDTPDPSRHTEPDVRLDDVPTRSPAVRRALIQVYRI